MDKALSNIGYFLVGFLPKLGDSGAHHIVIGQRVVPVPHMGEDQFATWNFSTDGNLYSGHYDLSLEHALEDAAQRSGIRKIGEVGL